MNDCVICKLTIALREAQAYNETGWDTAKILQRRVAALEKVLNDMVPGPYEPWLMLERSARDAVLRGGGGN